MWKTYVLRVRPRMWHIVDGIVCVDSFQVPTAPLELFDMATVQGGIRRALAIAVAQGPSLHEVRDVRQATVAPGTSIVGNGFVFLAMEFDDRHVLAAGIALDDDGVGVAVLVRSALVVRSRNTGESCDTSGSHRIASEDVSREATAVALARSVDLVRVDAVLVRDRVYHVHGETDVVRLGGGVALPLLVDTLRVCDQHVFVLR